MKYIKLFAIALAATFVTSCNDDDEFVANTNETVAGFESETLSTKESAGIINIPISVEGKRNGDISFEIVAEGTGENPAKEGENFLITEKNIKLLEKNDTTSSTTVNVQFQCLDDNEINDAREVTLTIKASNGVKVNQDKIVITLRDNDAAFYEKFQGKWTLTAKDYDGNTVSKQITITGAIDEDDPEYGNTLWVKAPALFNVGVSLDCEWPLLYTFSPAEKNGTLSHIMSASRVVASYGSSYQWVFLTDNGTSLTEGFVFTGWELGENDEFPTEISWGEDKTIYLYQPGAGYWDLLYDIKISR